MIEKVFYDEAKLKEYLHSLPDDQFVRITVETEAQESRDGEENSDETE